jgi:branched-chain amino acid transport system substrate-binding protein
MTLKYGAMAALAAAMLAAPVHAQDSVKVGVILPLTGPFTAIGRQVENGLKLYVAQQGNMVAGKKVELVVKDDGGNADATKRLAQDLIVNEKVAMIAGFGLTPLALATAPIATQAKIPQIVMAAGTSAITQASPYIVRTSFTLPQSSVPIAEWAAKNGIKKVMTVVTDYGPGLDAEKWFSDTFTKAGGTVESVRTPLKSPDFAPYLQKAADAKPDAIFVFVPAGLSAQFMKQYRERGLDKSGIKLIGTGDVTDDEVLNEMGDVAVGVVTAHLYSMSHDSPENKAYVEAYKKAYSIRPNFMSLGGYDGMHLIYEALKKTSGDTDADKLIAAMKGMSWVSPRGPISIDPETRDIIQNIYIREVKSVNGELHNVEFATIENVKDPAKAAAK